MSSSEIIEHVGISTTSYSDAVQNAIKAIQQKNKVHWFEVLEQRGRITADGNIEYQVIVRLGL